MDAYLRRHSALAAGETIASVHSEDTAMKRHLQLAGCALGVLLATACNSGGASGYQKSASPEGGVTAPPATPP